jgi:hypothetical protein
MNLDILVYMLYAGYSYSSGYHLILNYPLGTIIAPDARL